MKIILFFILIVVNSCSSRNPSYHCTYQYSIWNTFKKMSQKLEPKRTARNELEDRFKHKSGCSICEEDQVDVKLSNNIEFKMCYLYAEEVKEILENSLEAGYEIKSVTGYRPSMSRGPLDYEGNRTHFSSHSFGTAIDVNAEANGLYYNCKQWTPSCSLRIGGQYLPGENPLSLTENSLLVKEMKENGFYWGGELSGDLKDFMHFSSDPL